MARSPKSLPEPPGAPSEWPTWVLVPTVHAAWLGAVFGFHRLGPLLGTAALVAATCWFTSLQHELIHGHPSRSRRLNRWLGILPLGVFYPFELYRRSHLAHHRDEGLTEPGLDPESNYVSGIDYAASSAWRRWGWRAQRTVLGRLLIGPPGAVVPAWFDIVRLPLRGDFRQSADWALHLALLAGLLWCLDRHAQIGPLRYVLTVAYPALGLSMLRSFYEHRPAEDAAHRVVVNEAGLFWRLLYLNNNYHAVHHERPDLPWHALRRHYLAHRADVLRRNGGFVLDGYLPLVGRYAWVTVDSPVHPARNQRSA